MGVQTKFGVLTTLSPLFGNVTYSNGTSDNGRHYIYDYIPPNDEEELANIREMKGFIETMVNLIVATGIILSVIGLLLFSTIIFNRELRTVPALWYLCHMAIMSIYTGLVIQPLAIPGIFASRGMCYFVMYVAEYIYFGLSVHLVIFNIELLFTKVLPLPKWQSFVGCRFVITTLIGWLITCLLATHVVIDNATELTVKNNIYFCLVVPDRTVQKVQYFLRELFPAIISLLFVMVAIVTTCLKRSRMLTRWRTGSVREVSGDVSVTWNDAQWLRCMIYIDVLWIVRGICSMILRELYMRFREGHSNHEIIMVIMKAHSVCLFLLPMAFLFIEEVRKTVYALMVKILHVVSAGRIRLGEDQEVLSVSFGRMPDDP